VRGTYIALLESRMRPLLLILALLVSHTGCAQPLSTRRLADESPAIAQRNGRTKEVTPRRVESGRAATLPEAEGASSEAPREGAASTFPVPTGTAGRGESPTVTDGSGTTATVGSAETEAKNADAPFSYSVAVEQPRSNRGRLAAAIALGAALVAAALWAVRRRLGP
jgi:hypothetical protein